MYTYQKNLGSFFFMKHYNCPRIQTLTLGGTNVSSKYCQWLSKVSIELDTPGFEFFFNIQDNIIRPVNPVRN